LNNLFRRVFIEHRLSFDTPNLSGETTKQPQRTHLMDVATMAAFITAISAEMASRGYPVPIKEGIYA